jgi:pimeloyl-ACP methyl ester carboxylesterase
MKKDYLEQYVLIGGIQQYFLHYNAGDDAPVMLFIHGGPGSPETNLAYKYKEFWGDLYTLVFWDQRGCGKTLARNPRPPRYPINIETAMQDLHAIVEYLKKLYHRKKIVIHGHSWGSIMGSLYALEHPENVSLYIGYGVLVNEHENERVALGMLREAITKAGNQEDLRKLEALGEMPPPVMSDEAGKKMRAEGALKVKYGVVEKMDKRLSRAYTRSPAFRLPDLSVLLIKQALRYQAELLTYLFSFDLEKWAPDYAVPVCYIQGERDHTTETSLAVKYFEKIRAPGKLLKIIPGGGHNTAFFEAREFRDALAEAKKLIRDGD